MNRKKYWLLGSVMLLFILLAACGNGQRAGSENVLMTQAPETPSTVPEAEDSISSITEPPGATAGPSETGQGMETKQDMEASTAPEYRKENMEMKMNVQIGSRVFTATLENNPAADALIAMMEESPVTIQMSDYAGFEKVGPLGASLPTSNRQATTQAGDIVLYQGNQIVVFYGSNSWSYTRLGKIDELTGWEEALGSGDVTVTFSLED